MGNRTPVQTDKTEHSAEILLWRECQCHQNSDLGNAHRQSLAYGDAKGAQTLVEFLRAGDNGQNTPNVLP